MRGVIIRKKPVTVTAERYGDRDTGQWTPDCIGELAAFLLDKPRSQVSDDEVLSVVMPAPGQTFDPDDGATNISVYDYLHDTWVKVYLGQWVIRGVKGETYPCDHEVLEETYETVGAVDPGEDPVDK